MNDNVLKEFINHSQPFGPIDADLITEKSVIEALFEKDNRIYKEFLTKPTIIIGRRGSGKTSFMRSVYLEKNYKFIVEMKSHEIFGDILTLVDKLSTGSLIIEEISELWNVLLWFSLMNEIVTKAKSNELSNVRKYLAKTTKHKKVDFYTVLKKFLNKLETQKEHTSLGIFAEMTNLITFEDVNFDEARNSCLEYLRKNNWDAIILLDTLENMNLDEKPMSYAIGGLLRCLYRFRTPGTNAFIMCCLPAEIYHKFIQLSYNPSKDFSHKLILHWHAGELLKLACERYAIFLRLYYPSYYKELHKYDLRKRSHASSFWNKVFPSNIENRLGVLEETLAYILRHTQLLPRHFLLYLNEIARKNLGFNEEPLNFSEQSVLEGVFHTENTICREIFSSYRSVYPAAQNLCKKCIPHLPLNFRRGELHHVYNIAGRGFEDKGIHDIFDFERLMIETGIIGRKIAKQERGSRYLSALFEYSVPMQLNINDDDILCLHPVVLEVYRAKKPKPGSDEILITYPYGSDIDGEDKRDIT